MMVVVATRVPEGCDEVAGFRGFGSHARPQPWAASKMRPRPNKPLPLIVRQHDNVGILLRQAGFYVLARTAVRVDLSEIAVVPENVNDACFVAAPPTNPSASPFGSVK
jgi:hypothetical protein